MSDDIRTKAHDVRAEVHDIRVKLQSIRKMLDNIPSKVNNIRTMLDNIRSKVHDIRSLSFDLRSLSFDFWIFSTLLNVYCILETIFSLTIYTCGNENGYKSGKMRTIGRDISRNVSTLERNLTKRSHEPNGEKSL